MATYSYVKCPHCNLFLGQRFANERRWGSPIRECPQCKKQYIDKNYHEVAVEGFSSTDKFRTMWWYCAFFSWLPICFAKVLTESVFPPPPGKFTYVSDDSLLVCSMVSILLLIISICGIVRASKRNLIEMQEESWASEKRLSDPRYAFTLKSLGYDVPSRYLTVQSSSSTSDDRVATKGKINLRKTEILEIPLYPMGEEE